MYINFIFMRLLNQIVDKIERCERISSEEAVILYDKAPLFLLSHLATAAKLNASGDKVFYNKNFHLEPTNICLFHCKFCSYRKEEGEEHSWDMSMEEIREYVKSHLHNEITEVHLVGGVNPRHDLQHYCDVIAEVRAIVGESVTIKAFSAIEHIYVIEKAGLSYREGLKILQSYGLDTITGGGAEIFDEKLRQEICHDKATTEKWLAFHREAHLLGIKTNATMLYGHCETLQQRIDHLERLRKLQDETGGFTTFIPLKYRSKNNSMSHLGECSITEDMRTIAISRLFLDNFKHIKAYSPMYGKSVTQSALLFGADDIDGTVKSSTKIYSMAGVSERGMEESEMIALIEEAGYKATERF